MVDALSEPAKRGSVLSEAEFRIAPCLRTSDIADDAQSLIVASRSLGCSAWASVLRAWCVPYLFQSFERFLVSGQEPISSMNQSMNAMVRMLRAVEQSGIGESLASDPERFEDTPDRHIEEITGEHYGRLFDAFSLASYWDEPVKLLSDRLGRNGIPTTELSEKTVLDAGCGGGRYTAAWALLGARSAIGCDVSETGLSDAKRRVQEKGFRGVNFEQGNVLALPFASNRFDIVFSNGVLHHTIDWERGVEELVRVLKPGGLGWLYLIENPGGLFWDMIEVLRVIMKDENRETARNALRSIRMPANRIFYMLDHVMVPINIRLSPLEIESSLIRAGATGIRRLRRGTDFDRIEHIYQKRPFARLYFGVGENRYVFSKN
jgi:SAM-dependent methyltransferase